MLRKIQTHESKLLPIEDMSRILGGDCQFSCGCGHGSGNCGTSTSSATVFSNRKAIPV